jgi:orotidine-5'-phosphate decarboxylase
MTLNTDALYEAVAAKGLVCVGLDTAPDYIPPAVRRKAGGDAEAVLAFNTAIIEATADVAACFKVQIAYYEALGLAGLAAYAHTLAAIRRSGSLVIADIKRGDIADTAARYAAGHFSGDFEADFVTLSPYMGMDSLEPWLAWADRAGKGAFVLTRTSNKGMRDFEYQELKTGGRLFDAVGGRLSSLCDCPPGTGRRGVHGYGAVGAVVGCTEAAEAAAIRAKWPNLFFLIPGYGAQGGGAATARALLRNNNGGVVNASRSILKAWQNEPGAGQADFAFAAAASRREVIRMREELTGQGNAD